MTSRERVLAVLAGDTPDRIPWSSGFWGSTAERWWREGLPEGIGPDAYFGTNEIDRMGGAVSALESGYQTREIHESAFKHQREVESEDRVVVGVNRYRTDEPPIGKLQTIDPKETVKQIERVKRVRSERDSSVTQAALDRLKTIASGSDNTVPSILECVEAYATVGEITDVFRGIFGEQQDASGM